LLKWGNIVSGCFGILGTMALRPSSEEIADFLIAPIDPFLTIRQ
jgi:hypothetical protein